MKTISTIDAYLQPSKYFDFHHESIQQCISTFQQETEIEKIKAAFEFVRDHINHSYDIQSHEVTRKASEVLDKQHGICYAKSHLLAAIYRGMGIPSGICYQKLTLYDEPKDGYCVHALNTVYIKELDKWIRLDARGNKEGVNAQFSTEKEMLAFPIRKQLGEKDYLINYDKPHPDIIQTLETHTDCVKMYQNGLPEELS